MLSWHGGRPVTSDQAIDVRNAALAGLLESYRREGAEAWFTTQGVSMLPLIRPGSRLLVEFGARPAIGEVVLFSAYDRYLAHRVVGRRREAAGELLIVKGDAEAYPDRSLQPTEILGVVRAIRWPGHDLSRLTGLGGRSGRFIAAISLWSGRAARTGHRLITGSPCGMHRAGLRTVATIARVPTRLVTAPMNRFGAERR
jgi:hypothetical protein